MLAEAARRFGDRAAYVAEAGWSLSYRDLDRLTDEVAAGLAERGIGPGDVVALCLPTIPEYAVAYLGIARVGAITAGVNSRLSTAERARVLQTADPSLVLATAELGTGIGARRARRTGDRPGNILLSLRVHGASPPALADDPERQVAIIFTSGTTGAPKGAVFCNRQLSAITAIDVGDRWDGGGTSLAGTSLAHLGFMTKLPGFLRQGSTAHLVRKWRADEALRFTAEHRLSSVAGIPTQLALMLRVPDFDTYDLSSVRAIVIGGGPATPALVRAGTRAVRGAARGALLVHRSGHRHRDVVHRSARGRRGDGRPPARGRRARAPRR